MTMDGFVSPVSVRPVTAAAARDCLTTATSGARAAGTPPAAPAAPEGILRLRSGLRRELLLLISIKVAMLWLLYVLFFSPAHRPAIDVIAHIAGRAPH